MDKKSDLEDVNNGHKVLRLRGGMVSQGSECDSNCVPGYMQEVNEDDMEEICACREVEDFPILVASGFNTEPIVDVEESNIDEAGQNKVKGKEME
ncbi:hypothetical protein AgCh_032637 [Apium graveolens]